MTMNIIFILLAMTVWGVVHSFMASLSFKAMLTRTIGSGGMRFYRLLYNGFALVSFLPVIWLVASLPNQPLYSVPAPWKYLMAAGQAAAFFCLGVTLVQTDFLAFAGLKQIYIQDEKSKLVKSGLYRIVRHPLYTFSLMFLWLTPEMSVNTLVFYIGVTLYFIIGAHFEERKLVREFGVEYEEYMANTPMLIPFRF
jgi:protein-S-isoprenylcysteine O-methyltransferase Ste14